MPRTVSELRMLDDAECAYLLLIEGIAYGWVTDHPYEGLLGSGEGSWVGESEAELDSPELVGARTILPGLKMPKNIPIGSCDLKTGMPLASPATFELVDYGGELLALFATEDHPDPDQLGQYIDPGTTALPTSIICQGGLGVNPRGKHLGLEKIGPSGERRQFPPFPFPLQGFQHAPSNNTADGPPTVTVSDDPLDFAGRWVALYRLYRDDTQGSTGYQSWPTWREQYEAKGLVWIGKLRDAGELDGPHLWKLSCHGHDSFLRRRLGSLSPSDPWTITSAEVTLADHERQIAIVPLGWVLAWNLEDESDFQILELDDSVLLSASATAAEYAAEISALLAGVLDGSQANALLSRDTADTVMEAKFSLDHVQVRRSDGQERGALIRMSLHEKVWRILGYEPAYQTSIDPTEENYVNFEYGGNVPEGYWIGYFLSCPAWKKNDKWSWDEIDNDGNFTYWRPAYPGGVHILTKGAGQRITFNPDIRFLEGQLTVPISVAGNVDGQATTHARYFAFKGPRASGRVTGGGQVLDETGAVVEGVDAEETIQVALCEWREAGGQHGSMTEENGGATIHISRWMDPRLFGFDYDMLDGEWSFLSGGIEVYPLNTYAYAYDAEKASKLEEAASVFSQILLSTGTAPGYTDPHEDTPDFTTGANGDGTSYAFGQLNEGGDCELADLGLGIPSELVAGFDQIRAAFATAGEGLNSVRYAYYGAFESFSTIESLIATRGLLLTFRGGRFGVGKLGPFDPSDRDVEIVEADLYGEPGDPGSVIPKQELRAVGQLDKTIFKFDYHPIDGGTTRERIILARDPGALHRPGDIPLTLEEHGLRSGQDADGDIDDLWAEDRAKYFSARHFLVTNLTISRPKGQDLAVGSRVLFTNPAIVAPTSDGYTGVTKAAGMVTKVSLDAAEHSYKVELLVFAGQFGSGWKYFCPVGRVRRVTGTTVVLYPDSEFMGHGEGSDAQRMWTEPSSSELGGNAQVAILEFDRVSWTLSNVAEVLSVDPDNDTIFLASGFSSTVLRDTDKFLVMLGADDQGAAWVQQLGLPVVLDTHRYGSGPTKGAPFNDKK
jgi:hypothetical protein